MAASLAGRREHADRGVGRLAAFLRLARPVEWLKNVLVLAPLVFGGRLDDLGAIVAAALAFVAFCLVSSAGYAVNDTIDAPLDREHPVKARRPIASGVIRPAEALWAAGLAALAALLLAVVTAGVGLAAVVAVYALLTVSYSLGLKRLVIVDVMVIAACFLTRVIGGSVAVDVEPSAWLLVCTGAVALFLGFTKRRQEAMSEARDWRRTRPVLEHYSIPFLDQMVSLVTAMAIISYTIYATDAPLGGQRMLATVPPVLYALFRFLYLVYDRHETRDVAQLVLRDPGLLAAAAVWLLAAVVVVQL
jgi:4-hydroxybenzoate polyprenyltransferase